MRGRELMPETAAMVDELRREFGAELIDGAIASGQRARRAYGQMVSDHGPHAANAWLARQALPRGCFWASENGHEVGVRRP